MLVHITADVCRAIMYCSTSFVLSFLGGMLIMFGAWLVTEFRGGVALRCVAVVIGFCASVIVAIGWAPFCVGVVSAALSSLSTLPLFDVPLVCIVVSYAVSLPGLLLGMMGPKDLELPGDRPCLRRRGGRAFMPRPLMRIMKKRAVEDDDRDWSAGTVAYGYEGEIAEHTFVNAGKSWQLRKDEVGRLTSPDRTTIIY